MKKMRYIMTVVALAIVFSCDNVTEERVANNEFTLESEAPQWRPDATESGIDTLVFGWEAADAQVGILHDVTSTKWQVRCSLDDSWANYIQVDDTLMVEVDANVTTAERVTYAEVVIGENARRIVIVQGFYPRGPSVLPETGWDEDEDSWTGTK